MFLFYMRGVFLAVCISVGLCFKIMWCIPLYRGLSSCCYFTGAFDTGAFSVNFIVDRFSLPIFIL